MLTTEQIATLKADILASTDQAVIDARTAGNNGILRDIYNAAASPAFTVWRTRVPRSDVMADGFDWTQVDNLTNGAARIWDWLFADGPMNPADAGQRAGVAEVWKGTAAKLAVQAFVLSKCKRTATRAEKLLATGTGTDASPATLTFEGTLSLDDVRAAVA